MTGYSNKEPILFLKLLFQFRIFGPALSSTGAGTKKLGPTKVAIWEKLHIGDLLTHWLSSTKKNPSFCTNEMIYFGATQV